MAIAIFLIFAALAVFCGLNVVLRRHPIASALWLIGVMVSLAVLYGLLGAHFLAAAQVIVYAGAIMVLFVMVIMLVNAAPERRSAASRMAQALGFPVLAGLLVSLGYVAWRAAPRAVVVTPRKGSAHDVGSALFTTYLLPFEIVSLLVLIAILGAVVLTYKEKH
ncbi:MAG: NADH-quinone oxidoreductase subunit J [Acidobacteria bacterium]|nr:NADH-quinone oxidoreductase subunit J [Acidobacteriota bacterium]